MLLLRFEDARRAWADARELYLGFALTLARDRRDTVLTTKSRTRQKRPLVTASRGRLGTTLAPQFFADDLRPLDHRAKLGEGNVARQMHEPAIRQHDDLLR